eukprot:TRINITY_DN35965_c0_g1_i1.p1 TRINITY_DN35965_c0_g1~~TRINITY_DN35965_c0_g1_i1.p1  ORF type:complete len:296 (+),score=99.88 TRINITY_DN35965_c0_g1_i1:56-889(+)
MPDGANSRCVARRRWAELCRLERSDYFDLAQMQERAPELYHAYVGQFDSEPLSRAPVSPRHAPPFAGSPTLRAEPPPPPPAQPLHQLAAEIGGRRGRRVRAFGAMDDESDEIEISDSEESAPAGAGMEEVDSGSDVAMQTDCGGADADYPAQPPVHPPVPPVPAAAATRVCEAPVPGCGEEAPSEDERAAMREQLVFLMKRRFLDGLDSADYAAIDADAGLEPAEAVHDDTDEYFGEADESWTSQGYRVGVTRMAAAAARRAAEPPSLACEANNWGL